jgi:hypothetical protein
VINHEFGEVDVFAPLGVDCERDAAAVCIMRDVTGILARRFQATIRQASGAKAAAALMHEALTPCRLR